jgi:ureidoglycolate lyase
VAANMILHAKPLTKQAFKPFGDVIEVSDDAEKISINYGLTERYHALTTLDVTEEAGKGIISVFRSSPKACCEINDKKGQLTIDCMERHPLSSQAFYPLSANAYLVVVAPAGEFDVSKLEVFLAKGNQGVNYHKGTWHHYSLALGETSDFLVVDRQGVGKNCDEVTLENTITIHFNLDFNLDKRSD